MTTAAAPGRARRWPLVVVALLGLGLALAPAIFQMFSRAPGGGEMIEDFEPYMTQQKLADFDDQLKVIGAARDDAAGALAGLDADQRAAYPSVVAFVEQWPAIDDDMQSMLATMQANVGNYRGVAALPPFVLFPWFFVLPGVLIAGVAGWILVADRGRPPARGRRIALTALGLGLVAAPAVFGMFTRAPGGATMIDGFRPFMTETKVGQIQGYFLTIGAGEGQLRRALLPDLAAETGRSVDELLPDVRTLNEAWPEISGDLAPMVGTMADNVDRFAGIAALPPFGLFPWFFVVPGVAVAALAWRSRNRLVAPVPVAGAATRAPLTRRRLARIVATTAVVGELVSLGAMNLLSNPSVATSTTTTRRPELAAAVAPPPTAPQVPTNPGTSLRTPVAAPMAPVLTPAPPAPTPPPPVDAPAPGPEGPVAASLPCPLPIEPAPPGGGVASLTPLLPLFGPFSAEAFAMLPAFEPFFPLMGPLMVAGQGYLTEMDPALTALIAVVAPLEEAGFEALAPLYVGQRQDVLDGEAALAEALAPLAEALAATPGAGCLPALEAMLVAGGPAPG